MTRKEIAYNILNTLRGGRSTNNDHISLRQVEFNVDYYRAMLIRRDFQRNGIVTRHFEQDLGCIELTSVNASKCCNLPLDCVVSRTVVKLPRMIRFNQSEAITVQDIGGLNTIPVIDNVAIQFLPFDRFTKNETKAYMIEDYLYVHNPKGMDTINVRGILEQPMEAAKFDCDGSDCFDEDSDYPISADLVPVITDNLLKGSFMMIAQTRSDTENDNIEDSHVETAPQNAKR